MKIDMISHICCWALKFRYVAFDSQELEQLSAARLKTPDGPKDSDMGG